MNAKKRISIYILINTVFLLPIGLLKFFDVELILAIHAVMILLYTLFYFVYLHLVLDLVICIYLISEKIKKKISTQFFLISILTILINIGLNILSIGLGNMMAAG